MFILRKLGETVELKQEFAQSCDKTDFATIAGNPQLRLMQRRRGAA